MSEIGRLNMYLTLAKPILNQTANKDSAISIKPEDTNFQVCMMYRAIIAQLL